LEAKLPRNLQANELKKVVEGEELLPKLTITKLENKGKSRTKFLDRQKLLLNSRLSSLKS
jgi:hypothetical protein